MLSYLIICIHESFGFVRKQSWQIQAFEKGSYLMIQLLFFCEQKKQNSTTQLLVVNLRFHSESNKLAFSKLGHYLIFSAVFNELTLTALLMSFFLIVLITLF